MVIRFSLKLPEISGRVDSDNTAWNEIGFRETVERVVPFNRIC